MESLLHYIWKYKLYDTTFLFTSDNIPVSIIDPGMHNTDAGPDFFNAKIKIGADTWAGNVEIHSLSSDWQKHGHQVDKAYNSVVLHVVEVQDRIEIRSENGHIIPQLILSVPEKIKRNYEYLLNKDVPVSCIDRINEVPQLYLTDWKNALLTERLERKTADLDELLDIYQNDWGEVFYITLSRNFGFGINNDAFERLARSLPLKCILKHKNSTTQVEALFFGQAGLLDSEEIADEYYLSLKKEYLFLQKKFGLKPLEPHIFKSLRIRPNNFPHIKIAQLAEFIRSQEYLFSKILEIENINGLRNLFSTHLHAYWLIHYHFSKISVKKTKRLGLEALNIILINTVVPILFAYGKKKSLPDLIKRSIDLLESIKAEKNSITTLFSKAGILVHHAGDSQALIQLKREYCEKKKCIYCRIGHKLLAKQ